MTNEIFYSILFSVQNPVRMLHFRAHLTMPTTLHNSCFGATHGLARGLSAWATQRPSQSSLQPQHHLRTT